MVCPLFEIYSKPDEDSECLKKMCAWWVDENCAVTVVTRFILNHFIEERKKATS